MSLRRSAPAVTLSTLALCALLVPVAAHAGYGKWEPLGTRDVTDRIDHDTIEVTAKEGTFTKLQLYVIGHAVQFHSMKVIFANGETQQVALKQVIHPGHASRIIDLEGAARNIRRVEFVYDAQTLGKKGATVRLFGRH